MNTAEYLRNRGWNLFRTRWEGKPAQWTSPYENKTYPQSEAYKIEKGRALILEAAKILARKGTK